MEEERFNARKSTQTVLVKQILIARSPLECVIVVAPLKNNTILLLNTVKCSFDEVCNRLF